MKALLLIPFALLCGCSSMRFAPFATDGAQGVMMELDSEPVKTIADLEGELAMFRAIHLEALKQGDEPLQKEAMDAVLNTKGELQERRKEPVVEGKRTWPTILKDQFFDWENGVETSKSIASLFVTAAAGTYALGWWDEDDIFGGGGSSDETQQAQAAALQANAERNKNTIRINNTDNSTVEVRDLPQSDNISLEVNNGSGNTVVVDLQQDSGSNR